MATPSHGFHSAFKILEITPGATDLDPRPRGLYIGGASLGEAGTISVTNDDGTTEASIPVFAGSVLPIQPSRITAATVITPYGLYG